MKMADRYSLVANVAILFITIALFAAFAEAFVRLSGLEQPLTHQKPDPAQVGQRVLGFTNVHRVSSDPSLGWELLPGARGFSSSYTGGTTDLQINSLGFRDVEFDSEKPPGVFRILFLGDSMTFGLGVPLEETMPKVLEKLLNERLAPGAGVRFQVINAGVNGYNTYQQVMSLRKRGLALSPDMIILGFAANDVASPSLAGLPWASTAPEAVPNLQVAEGFSVSAPPSAESTSQQAGLRDAIWQRSALFRFAMRRWHAIKVRLGIEDGYDRTSRRYFDLHDTLLGDRSTTEWGWLSVQLGALRDTAAAAGRMPAVVVFLPWEHMLLPSYETKPQQALAAACAEFGLECVDPLPSFREQQRQRLFSDPLHFNGPGSQLAAEVIFHALTERKLMAQQR